ncbi:MAG: hypothetical protein ACOY4H_04970 [Thermodesulfobacteriota bacterium]
MMPVTIALPENRSPAFAGMIRVVTLATAPSCITIIFPAAVGPPASCKNSTQSRSKSLGKNDHTRQFLIVASQ